MKIYLNKHLLVLGAFQTLFSAVFTPEITQLLRVCEHIIKISILNRNCMIPITIDLTHLVEKEYQRTVRLTISELLETMVAQMALSSETLLSIIYLLRMFGIIL